MVFECSKTETVESKLDKAVQNGHWRTVDELLHQRLDKLARDNAITASIDRAEPKDLVDYIVPHCTGCLHKLALERAVERGLWEVVGLLLKHGANDAQFYWAMAEACERADQRQLLEHVFPVYFHRTYSCIKMQHCCGLLCPFYRQQSLRSSERDLYYQTVPTENIHFDLALFAKLVKRGMWHAVRHMLECHRVHLFSDDFLWWLLVEACEHASDENLTGIILGFPTEMFLDMLKIAVRRGLWDVVAKLMDKNKTPLRSLDENSLNVCRWAVTQAFKHGDDATVISLLPYVTDREMYPVDHEIQFPFREVDYVLTELVQRCLWGAVCKLLQSTHSRISREGKQAAVKEAIKCADDHIVWQLLNLCAVDRSEQLSTCAVDQNEQALAEAIERGFWDIVARLLQHKTIGEDAYRMAVQEGLKRADDCSLVLYILPHCVASRVDVMLEETVRRGLWGVVSKILRKRVSETQRRKAVEDAMRFADDVILCDILPLCADDQLECAMTKAVERRLWDAAAALLQRRPGFTGFEVIVQAVDVIEDAELLRLLPFCPEDQLECVLTQCVARGLWQAVGQLLQRGVFSDAVVRQTVEEASKRAHQLGLHLILPFCPEDQLTSVFAELMRRNTTSAFDILSYVELNYHSQSDEESAFLIRCLAYWLTAVITCRHDYSLANFLQMFDGVSSLFEQYSCSDIFRYICLHAALSVRDVTQFETVFFTLMIDVLGDLYDVCHKAVGFCCTKDAFQEIVQSKLDNICTYFSDPLQIVNESYKCTDFVATLFKSLFALQITNHAIQGFALSTVNSSGSSGISWDIVSAADVSLTWEEVRRDLFQKAVTQKQWAAVKHLADHNLYDDQRNWLMKIALDNNQWSVMVVLADHGLTDDQLRRVGRQVAKHADWDTVLQLFHGGANLRQVRQDLETANPSRLRPPDERKLEEDEYKRRLEEYKKIERDYKHRVEQLKQLEHQLTTNRATVEEAMEGEQWDVVFYRIFRRSATVEVNCLVQRAIEMKASRILIALVRRMLDTGQRNSLFAKMIDEELFDVGRALLERPLSRDLFADFSGWEGALQRLLAGGQWVLVARMMEYDVGNDLRRRVMKEALDRRQGSVVAHITSCMDGGLTVEERKSVFQQAITQGQWQAVRRLVEEQDDVGHRQRDTAMFIAMKERRWDVLQHCVHNGADIDKPDATGLTQLQQAFRPGTSYLRADMDKVRELLHLGANQFLIDPDGNTVLHSAFHHRIFDIAAVVKLLIQFHGDINQPDSAGHNALYYLIQRTIVQDAHDSHYTDRSVSADLVECSLLWGRDVGERVECKGKTVLHVLCEEGRHDAIRYAVARGADPNAVTNRGESVLLFAVCSRNRRYRYQDDYTLHDPLVCWAQVTECIKLGISTHQPAVTDFWFRRMFFSQPDLFLNEIHGWCSPVQQACKYFSQLQNVETKKCVVCSIIIIMLYESGSCSNNELNRLYGLVRQIYHKWRFCDASGVEQLEKTAWAPRSLQSLCRLRISHCVGVCKPKNRERRVKQLPILSDIMKDYVLFADLVRPVWFANKYFRTPDSREKILWQTVQYMKTAFETADSVLAKHLRPRRKAN